MHPTSDLWRWIIRTAIALSTLILVSACSGSKPPAAKPVVPAAASASSADKPTEPVAAEQKPAANAVSPITGKRFASGEYRPKQITMSALNPIVAFIATVTAEEVTLRGLGKSVLRQMDPYADTLSYPANFLALTQLRQNLRNSEDGGWLIIGSLQDPASGKFLTPGESIPDVNYSVSTLFTDPCADGSCTGFWPIEFRLYKIPSGDWRINAFSIGKYGLWNRNAFETRLKKAGNEPFKLIQ